ncbi:hypothetical protein N9L06_04365 [Mariniblastus sp.]|nr:hypothetical protein [Mariniblastus sp.]
MSKQDTTKTSGVIRYDELYTLEEFKSRMRLTNTAMRALRRKGFNVLRVGKRAFVSGFEAIAFLVEEGVDQGESESREDSFEVFGPTLGVPYDGETETEVGEDERQA